MLKPIDQRWIDILFFLTIDLNKKSYHILQNLDIFKANLLVPHGKLWD